MNKIEKDLEKIKQIKLREDEKALIRANLVDRINGRPLLSPYKFDFSPYVLISNWNRFSLMKVGSFAVLFMFIFGSSLTYASEQSLPGEALYSIKVNVKEEIEIKLANTPEKKANVEKAHIEKRLEEISTLKDEGNLTEENSAIVIDEFKERTQDLHESIDDLQDSGDSEVILEITQNLIPTLTQFVEESSAQTDTTKEIKLTKEIETEENPEITNSSDDNLAMAISSIISVATEEVEKMIAQETEVIEEVKEDTEITTEAEDVTTAEEENVSVSTETSSIEISETSTAVEVTTSETIIEEDGLVEFGILYGKILDKCISIQEDCTGKEATSGTILIYTKDKAELLKAIDVDQSGKFRTRLAPGNYVVDIRRTGTEKVVGVPETINIEKDAEIPLEINIFDKEVNVLGLPVKL